jgi:hypothetical protein
MTADPRRRWHGAIAALLAAALAWAPAARAAKTDITVEYDKKFSFAGLRTWTWHPDGAGDVRLAVSSYDDPKRVASRADPIILPAVEREMAERGFNRAASGAELYLHYYLLASVGVSSQTHGQFLPAVPDWGVPPFTPSTSAVSVYPVGTLIIDVTSPAANVIVWRGTARRDIEFESPDDKRRAVLERAVRDLVRRFPPKK